MENSEVVKEKLIIHETFVDLSILLLGKLSCDRSMRGIILVLISIIMKNRGEAMVQVHMNWSENCNDTEIQIFLFKYTLSVLYSSFRKIRLGYRSSDVTTFELDFDSAVQAWIRGILSRKHFRLLHQSAVSIQRYWRGYRTRIMVDRYLVHRVHQMWQDYYNEMATRIQAFWRGYWIRKTVLDIEKMRRWLNEVYAKNEETVKNMKRFGIFQFVENPVTFLCTLEFLIVIYIVLATKWYH